MAPIQRLLSPVVASLLLSACGETGDAQPSGTTGDDGASVAVAALLNVGVHGNVRGVRQ